MFKDWLDLLKKLPNENYSSETFICPECGQRSVEYTYVGNSITHIGYLPVWCKTCNKGIQIIRAIIPDGVKIIELGNLEEIKEAIPDYKQIFPMINIAKGDFPWWGIKEILCKEL
ncbi:MAG: hypothetical protein J6L65_01615 [Lachnospiraceae bacterium]|nr:hypothetical protein [Lachnospiraceae bacterium]